MESRSRAARIINTLLVVIVAFIGLHTLFVLFDGNPGNVIVSVVNAVAGFLLAPFEGIFRRQSELITALVGVLVYSLVAGIALAVDKRVGARGTRGRAPGTS